MAGKFTQSEHLTDFMRWSLENLEKQPQAEAHLGNASEGGEPVHLPTAEEIERIHQEAHKEGFEAGQREGYEAGMQSGQVEVAFQAERLKTLADSFDNALKHFEEELANSVGHEILALSLDVAKQMLRHALHVKPELLVPVVRSAMESLPQNVQHPHVHLHPDDAVLIRDVMQAEMAHAGWRIVEDARIMRGGCMIETASAEIDATLPSRWKRIAKALGQDSDWLDQDD
ncbi:flagellar assembly protein FliH [Novimethylophilus kurashikiensis]|uniref:Flagellar assembly protein FliH n=1 Tax=Novimethylophilus kurashikiensis TaxID=1825523 RepID=A0A2R5F6K0_9PROT|nr:flagellar assembly protein FliH [Novimethylophilus kurashikiensis]GBG12563.1 flagellar assembly protein FliH [Novimethylophilus kurashikiensis]